MAKKSKPSIMKEGVHFEEAKDLTPTLTAATGTQVKLTGTHLNLKYFMSDLNGRYEQHDQKCRIKIIKNRQILSPAWGTF
jgi:hypothetical protein